MNFKGYIIICKDKNYNCFYLLNNLEKGEFLSSVSIYESIFEKEKEDKIHKLEEDDIKNYIKELKERKFDVSIIISIFILDCKPFIGEINFP